MRLVQVKADGSFSLVKHEGTSIPPYAILSHTWGEDEDEVTFDDMKNKKGREKIGHAKLAFCATQAAKDGLQHFWIDTCCIDKSSSAELSEAITSMFRWYKNSDRCYVYLADVTTNKRKADQEATHSTWMPAFRTSRWFTRGWTLQELLAPRTLNFFSREGKELGNKLDLAPQIHNITHIPVSALQGVSLHEFSIEERMSWAARRETKREEDKAYSLLGIFGVSMVANYGEEEEAAFRRLRREIRETTGNDTIPLVEEEKRLFMRTLRFDQIDARHTAIKNAHAKTCKWLLDKSEYIDWLDMKKLHHHHGFLWIKGKPGTGKSTLMKFAFGKARKTKNHSVVITFFFNARGEALEKSVIGMYRSLLLQLLEQVPSLRGTFRSSSLSPSTVNAEYQWGVNSLEAELEQAVLGLGDTPVICFIDALDECEQRQVRNMVSFFENLGELATSSGKSFRVCFSSRHYPEITIEKGLSFELEGQEGHTQDIDDYIANKLRIGDCEKSQEAKKELQRKSSGVFMWVVLVVDILQEEYNRGHMDALNQRLQEIPDDLHRLFYEILTRDSCNTEALILSIQWVLFAEQSLTPAQLYLAILSGVEPEMISQWSPGAIPKEDTLRRFILDASKGLTEITESRVQFIHESVRDFLLKDNGLGRIWPHLRDNFEGQSHEQLKQCCLTLLHLNVEGHMSMSDDFKTASSQKIADARAAVSQAFPILEYAVQNILYHADAAQGAEIGQHDFMASFPLQKWVRLANLFERHKIRRYTSSVSLLYILGDRNMPNLIRCYKSANTCFHVEEERYGVPFFAAVATKSKEAVCAFVDILNQANGQGKLSPESYAHFYQDNHGRSLLPRDFKYSRKRNIVNWLIDLDDKAALCLAITANVVDVNNWNLSSVTLLDWATVNRHRDIVEALLSNDKVDVNAADTMGRTSLIWATVKGHRDIVEALLSNDKVDVNAADKMGRTPLIWATVDGQRDIVDLLLSTGKVDVNAMDTDCWTPLQWAISHADTDIVKLLVSTDDIDIDMGPVGENSPLMWAAMAGHKDIVELLLSTGKGHINVENGKSQTALMLAAENGHKDVIELLLSTDKADVNVKSNRDWTALLLAVGNGHKDVIELLLNTDKADVNLKSDRDWTALSLAVGKGYKDIVELLLSTDKVDVNVKNHWGQTALSLAVGKGYKDIVELLLSTHKLDFNVKNHWGQTALMLGAEKGEKEIVEMLLRDGKANPNTRDDRGMTLLIASARQGVKDMVKLLLKHNTTDINSKDKSGRTALSWAAWGERFLHLNTFDEAPLPNREYIPHLDYPAQPLSVVQRNRKRFLREKAERTTKSVEPNIYPDYEAVIELLIGANGVDVNSTDDDGCTPLFWAATNGRDGLVELLLNDHRVDPGRKDAAGFTALDVAQDNVRKKWDTLIRRTRTHKSTQDEVL